MNFFEQEIETKCLWTRDVAYFFSVPFGVLLLMELTGTE